VPNEENVIAVIDDDDGIRNALDRLLSLKGYRTELFSSATDFLNGMPSSKADCLVVDVFLGNASGIELIRSARIAGLILPTIFVTASTDPAQRLEALRVGCIAYLPKPFRSKQLLAAIELAMKTKSEG
jgi:FixJ family two-component response regulator